MSHRLAFFLALFVTAALVPSFAAPGTDDAQLRIAPGSAPQTHDLSWWGESGYSYFMQHSDDLETWAWSPVLEEPTDDGTITYVTTSASEQMFYRVEGIADPQSMLWRIDVDGDGMSNVIENGSPLLDPFTPDPIPPIFFVEAPGGYPGGGSVAIATEPGLEDYVYYTTDGSEPTAFDPVYGSNAPIALPMDAVTEIRAKTILPNRAEGAEISGFYKTGATATAAPQTVYYGHVTASGSVGYAYSISDLTTISTGNPFFQKQYLVMGTGWIVSGAFVSDTSAPARPLYYGLTAYAENNAWELLEGFSVDESVFYDARPGGGSGYNYRQTGSGWLTAFDGMTADPSAPSRTIYLQNVSLSANGELSNVWLYSEDPSSGAANGRSYEIGKGWVVGRETMKPDPASPATEVRSFLAFAHGSGSERIATSNASSQAGYPYYTLNSVRLGQGWAYGTGMVPDKSAAAPLLYYGEKAYSDGSDRRVIATVESDIVLSGSVYWPHRKFVHLGPGYALGGTAYEQTWAQMPQTVYRGTEDVFPADLPHENDFLAYDEGDLAAAPAPEPLGYGWIENNAFIEYIDDLDGLDLAEEIAIGTNPNSSDTDGDGLPDGFEHASAHLDPLVPNILTEDFDGDGLTSIEEMLAKSDPDAEDSDGDLLMDWEEIELGTALHSSDTDSDGIEDGREGYHGTDPLARDSDGDGHLDGEEIFYGTNPLSPDAYGIDGDANGDGLDDSVGLVLGYGPNDTDVDDDGLANALEHAYGTDPFAPDTDGDGSIDGQDAFPLDPHLSALPADGNDTTPPVLTLTTPASATAL